MKLKWETVDEEGLEGCGWSYRRTTHVTNVPGGDPGEDLASRHS